LIAARKNAGLRQVDVAEALKIPQQTIAYWECHARGCRANLSVRSNKMGAIATSAMCEIPKWGLGIVVTTVCQSPKVGRAQDFLQQGLHIDLPLRRPARATPIIGTKSRRARRYCCRQADGAREEAGRRDDGQGQYLSE
jgi:transcriptional regulator with XRE-family HTH domain